jgi:hypothetical protein
MADLDALYKWFDENRDAIIQNHTGECVLLKDKTVIAYFSKDEQALEYAKNAGFAMGDFLIQDCVSKDEECMYYYNEAVSFA